MATLFEVFGRKINFLKDITEMGKNWATFDVLILIHRAKITLDDQIKEINRQKGLMADKDAIGPSASRPPPVARPPPPMQPPMPPPPPVAVIPMAVPRPGTNCIKIGLPGKLILSKRKGLREVIFS